MLTLHFFNMTPYLNQAIKLHGDATLITFPSGEHLLVDVSEKGLGTHVAQRLLALGVSVLDAVLITHVHSDHAAGFRELSDLIAVKKVLFSGYGVDNPYAANDFLQVAAERSIPLETIGLGTKLSFGDAVLEVLWPDHHAPKPPEGTDPVETSLYLNHYSTVFRLAWKRFSGFFAADIHAQTEENLIQLYPPESCTLLKLPHHGHNTSTTARFLEWLRPRLAIHLGNQIDTEVTDNLKRYEVALYSTMRDGEIRMEVSDSALHIICDGGRYEYSI